MDNIIDVLNQMADRELGSARPKRRKRTALPHIPLTQIKDQVQTLAALEGITLHQAAARIRREAAQIVSRH